MGLARDGFGRGRWVGRGDGFERERDGLGTGEGFGEGKGWRGDGIGKGDGLGREMDGLGKGDMLQAEKTCHNILKIGHFLIL